MFRIKLFNVYLILYFLGFLISGYLIYLSLSTSNDNLCALFFSDCNTVLFSSYAYLLSFSNSSLGFAYYIFAFIFVFNQRVFFEKSSKYYSLIKILIFCMHFLSMLFSLYYVFVLIVILEQFCIFCYMIHTINLFLFILSFAELIKKFDGKKSFPISDYLKKHFNLLANITLIVLVFFLSVNLLESRIFYKREKEKNAKSLRYYLYLYEKSPKNDFTIDPGDIKTGFQNKQLIQLVLIYKDKCYYCKKAQKKLKEIVTKHSNIVYMIEKNYKNLSEERLKQLNIKKVPAVFINGKFAEAWDIPGFLTEFIKNCEC